MTRLLSQELMDELPDVQTLAAEGTDLQCALVGCAIIERALESVLYGYFESFKYDEEECDRKERDSAIKRILGGSIKAAGNRNYLAYIMGVTLKNTFKNIECILDIRNAFAHSHTKRSFGESEIVKMCEDFTLWEEPESEELEAVRQQMRDLYWRTAKLEFENLAKTACDVDGTTFTHLQEE